MIYIHDTTEQLAQAAAAHAADSLRSLLSAKPQVRLLAATGASQIWFLERLAALGGIEWQRVELFHPASFARYIKERIVDQTGIVTYHLLDGTRDPGAVAAEMGALITSARVDLAFVGIGENGHLAFNDPPADFETEESYLVVDLDYACRQQHLPQQGLHEGVGPEDHERPPARFQHRLHLPVLPPG